jgi:putative N6-adenine-specific DNA methylase
MAKGLLPGSRRRFAFMDWPDFSQALWESLRGEVTPHDVVAVPPVLSFDRDRGAIEAARENAGRAGVAGSIEFSCRPISAIEPPLGPGWIVTNPPYGVRASRTKDLRDLYAAFGRILREKCPGWHTTMLCGNVQLQRSIGLGFGPATIVDNGGLRVRLVKARIPS